MSVLLDYVGDDMKNLIINIFNKMIQVEDFDTMNQSNRIGYINIFHNKWVVNEETNNLLEIVSKFLNVNKDKILTMNFLISKPQCKNQHYHIDYEGKTETYFIPLCELNNLNGTEIVEFNIEPKNFYFNKLLELSNTCYHTSELIEQFNNNNIIPSSYTIKYVNSDAFSLIKIPYHLMHRGRTNETTTDRIMFSVVIAREEYTITSDKCVPDAELDEPSALKSKDLKSRMLLNNLGKT
jgi:hypothetical protein